MTNKRVSVYDWVRLLATVFVIIGHSIYLSNTTNLGGVFYDLPAGVHPLYSILVYGVLERLRNWVYDFHMALFFMLSGAVLALRPLPSFDRFVTSKAKRLILPYFVWGLLFLFPVKMIAGFYDGVSFSKLVIGLFTGNESGHLWFLTSLFWCMIVFWLLRKATEKIPGIGRDVLLVVITTAVYYTWGRFPFDFLGFKMGLHYLLFFTTGYVFENVRARLPRIGLLPVAALTAAMAVLEFVHLRHHILGYTSGIFAGSAFTFLVADLLDRLLPKIPEWPLWKLVQRNLIYVYLFHDPLNYLILQAMVPGEILCSAGGVILYLLMRTLLLFAVCVLLGECVQLLKKKGKTLLAGKEA